MDDRVWIPTPLDTNRLSLTVPVPVIKAIPALDTNRLSLIVAPSGVLKAILV